MPSRLQAAVALAVAAAQPPAVTVSIESGATSQAIARFDGERWFAVAGEGCLAREGDRRVASSVALERVSAGDRRLSAIEAAVARVFEQRQREHRLVLAGITDRPMTLDWVYAAANDAGAIYYFEASRRVPDPGTAPEEDPRGTLRIVVSGWLRADAGGEPAPVASRSELRWEQDQENGAPVVPLQPDLLPLAIVRRDGQTIWVMRQRIGTIERFTLYDVGATGVGQVVQAAANVCP